MIKLRQRYKAAGDVFKALTDKAEWDVDTAVAFLEKVPDADVEEVVRCKDCRFFKHDGTNDEWYCRKSGADLEYVEALTHFCSYGERRADYE